MAKNKKKKTLTGPSHWSIFQSSFYVLGSIVVSVILYQTGTFHQIIHAMYDFGYIGAFVAGMFFVSIFTAAPAAVVLLTLSESLSFIPLIIFAGFGSVIGDMVILSLLTQKVSITIQFLPKERGVQKLIKSLRLTKYKFFLTLIGAIVVASPLPDELGLALMGATKIKPLHAIALTFFLNTVGITLLLLFLT